ncbi:MAG: hypothetical protein J5802_03150 [Butyrivibrio sp.]|nr:hypothetical protein [Butyrivibrio sp.]
MVEKKKDSNYRNFNNRTAFDGRALKQGEILVPVVLSRDMKETLRPAGIRFEYAESWHFPNAKEIVPVVFIPIEDVPGALENSMKIFNSEVEWYLKHLDDRDFGGVSLDALMQGDEDDGSYDPTGTTDNEDTALLEQIFEMLIDDLNELDPNMGRIIELLAEGYKKKEIVELVDIGKGRSQAYSFIEKTQKLAKEIYSERYSD